MTKKRFRLLTNFSSRQFILEALITAFLLSAPAANANVIGTDAQNFNSTTSGLDFVTVHSSETLKPGIINLGLFFNYAVNTLPYYDSSPQNRLNWNDSILGMDMNAGIGLAKDWDVGISFPQVLSQSVDQTAGTRGEFGATGATEIRFNSKYRLYGDDTGGIAVVGSMNLNRIENNPYVGQNAGPSFNVEAVADTLINSRVAVGGNVGMRIRNPGAKIPTSFVTPLKNQLIASAALSYYVPDWNSKLIGELYGSLPAENSDSFGDRSLTSLEALAGIKHDVNTNLALHAGAATGLVRGVASPDWRVYTGLNYTFGPLWGKDSPSSPPQRPQLVAVAIDRNEGAAITERFRTQAILFEFDSDKMVGNFAPALDELATHLSSGFRKLVVEGHTDSIGKAAYNERLSLRRANAIRAYMISHHKIDGRKIEAMGYGARHPIADNGNYQGRQANRRVEFQITR
jgi:outer membrane protein OmpA-like peptidoglycan-associated protein